MIHLHSSRVAMESRAKGLTNQTRSRLQFEMEIREAALKVPNRFKWAVLTTIYGFYGSLMYCVWDVYSWDVMEPITYFIGFSAVLGNSFYHSFTKKVHVASNLISSQGAYCLVGCNVYEYMAKELSCTT